MTSLERRLALAFPQQHSCIGLWGDGNSEYFAALRALMNIGRIVVPLNTKWSAVELAGAVRSATLCGMLYLNEFPETFASAITPTPCISLYDLPADSGFDLTLAGVDDQAAAILVATSGSSGEVKFVEFSKSGIAAHARAVCDHLSVTARDTWLVCLPLFHVGGLMIPFRCMAAGASFAFASSSEAAEINYFLDSGEATLVSVVPTQLRRMLDARSDRPYPKSVRAIIVGGAAVPPELIKRCPQALPTYGMTESGSMISCARPDCDEVERFSAGALLPQTRVRVDSDSEELQITGPGVATGYWNNEAQSRAVFQNGWVHTGDIGRIDERGCLHIMGRSEALIKCGGEKISLQEIERALTTHPDVHTAVVVGLADSEWGEIAAAYVLRQSGCVTRDDLREYLRSRLADFKIPRKWLLADSLPLLGNEKPDLGEIRRRLLAAT